MDLFGSNSHARIFLVMFRKDLYTRSDVQKFSKLIEDRPLLVGMQCMFAECFGKVTGSSDFQFPFLFGC